MNAVDVVQRQLEAYNAHDLAGFAAMYSDTIEIFRMPSPTPTISGKAELVRFYGTQRFNLPALHADVVNRISLGNKVVDHERIVGLGEHPVEIAAVYEVLAGVIENVWFFTAE